MIATNSVVTDAVFLSHLRSAHLSFAIETISPRISLFSDLLFSAVSVYFFCDTTVDIPSFLFFNET